ncbi:protein PIN-LIKES 6-like isoform X1 [Zingiber officinale]|uniref:protein PIN-LIKES 6-like isoform X1 n=1 Tax=Zingiber officinale TaxID=94328 RepID=UPI001C4D39A6|nr:protein PIN-LIKES 6-like isoform X1 [Zingiber officinale]
MRPSRRSPLFLVCEQAIFLFPSRGQHSSDPSPSLEHCGPQPSILFSPSRALTGQIIGILWYIVGKLKLKQIFQPPIIASALAIIIGAIPFLKNFILTDDTPLFFFTDSCLILGEAMIPCILLALGGNLVDGSGPGSKRLGLRTTAAIIFGRLVLVPPTGLGIITIADKLGLFPRGDKMFKFVLLLQHTMPERYVQHLCHHHLYAIYSGEMT